MSTHYVKDSQNVATRRRKFCMTVRMEQQTQYQQCRLSGDTVVCHLNVCVPYHGHQILALHECYAA